VDNYSRLHLSQKPIELLEYLIKTYTNENEVVLDCFADSGSTMVAAKNLNRKYIGVEKDTSFLI
jgi:site-specific DNA-methyltransferase (adenine-specific)